MKMNVTNKPLVSFVLATHNRHEVVCETVAHLSACGLSREDFQVLVVDNASQDGTADALEGKVDTLIRLDRNAGSCAKAFVTDQALAPFIVMLDDDARFRRGFLERMIERFHADPQLGAAGFSVFLPDGSPESSALPGVFHGCGVGFRTVALREVGGLDPTFFMQAEEYDLSFRLAGAGWRVEVFDDLVVDHLKSPISRRQGVATYYDVRNNLRLVARYLPAAFARPYRQDWLKRYAWLAGGEGHRGAYWRGRWAARREWLAQRRQYRKHRLRPGPLEAFFRWGYVGAHMAGLSLAGIRRIILAGFGKNLYAFYRGAQGAGLSIGAIGDDRFAASGRRYRGVPILPMEEALRRDAQVAVVTETVAVFADRTAGRARKLTGLPVYNWFGPMPSAGTHTGHQRDEHRSAAKHRQTGHESGRASGPRPRPVTTGGTA